MIHQRSIEVLVGSRLERLDNMQLKKAGEVVHSSQAALTPLIRLNLFNCTENVLMHAQHSR